MHELERQLLSSQILVESLADILIQKGIMTQEEIQEVCQSRVDLLTAELKKEQKKQIKKTKLEEYIIKRHYNNRYYENIDFVRKVLELYLFQIPKKQTSKLYYYHVDFKYGEEEEGY